MITRSIEKRCCAGDLSESEIHIIPVGNLAFDIIGFISRNLVEIQCQGNLVSVCINKQNSEVCLFNGNL